MPLSAALEDSDWAAAASRSVKNHAEQVGTADAPLSLHRG